MVLVRRSRPLVVYFAADARERQRETERKTSLSLLFCSCLNDVLLLLLLFVKIACFIWYTSMNDITAP